MKSEPRGTGQFLKDSKYHTASPGTEGTDGADADATFSPGFGSGWMSGWLWRLGWRSQVCRPPGKSEIPVYEVPFPQGDACCPDVGHLTCRQGQASLKGFPLLEPTPQSPSLCGSRMCTFSLSHTHPQHRHPHTPAQSGLGYATLTCAHRIRHRRLDTPRLVEGQVQLPTCLHIPDTALQVYL